MYTDNDLDTNYIRKVLLLLYFQFRRFPIGVVKCRCYPGGFQWQTAASFSPLYYYFY